MTKRVCSTADCPNLTDQAGRCPTCSAKADRARGTATERGYKGRGHRLFREAVLTRDPVCVCVAGCDWHIGAIECMRLANTADHYPLERWDLVARGLDPNDPSAGQGLCARCHAHKTATTYGGWAATA
jgi:5-methylcytosine-specific restriction enzyme A